MAGLHGLSLSGWTRQIEIQIQIQIIQIWPVSLSGWTQQAKKSSSSSRDVKGFWGCISIHSRLSFWQFMGNNRKWSKGSIMWDWGYASGSLWKWISSVFQREDESEKLVKVMRWDKVLGWFMSGLVAASLVSGASTNWANEGLPEAAKVENNQMGRIWASIGDKLSQRYRVWNLWEVRRAFWEVGQIWFPNPTMTSKSISNQTSFLSWRY